MKCLYCGNNLSLEEKNCPFCGKENEQAALYVKEIEQEKETLEKTREEIRPKKEKRGYLGKITIIVILILGLCYLTQSYSLDIDVEKKVEDEMRQHEEHANSNLPMHTARIDELIHNRDYLGVYYYESDHHLGFGREYLDTYYSVSQVTIGYQRVYVDTLCLQGDATEYPYPCESREDVYREIGIYMVEMQTFSEQNQLYYTEERFAGEKGEYLKDIKIQAGELLQTYFDLTEAEVDAIYQMTEDEAKDFMSQKYQEREVVR